MSRDFVESKLSQDIFPVFFGSVGTRSPSVEKNQLQWSRIWKNPKKEQFAHRNTGQACVDATRKPWYFFLPNIFCIFLPAKKIKVQTSVETLNLFRLYWSWVAMNPEKTKGTKRYSVENNHGLKFIIIDNFFCLLSSTTTTSPVSGF